MVTLPEVEIVVLDQPEGFVISEAKTESSGKGRSVRSAAPIAKVSFLALQRERCTSFVTTKRLRDLFQRTLKIRFILPLSLKTLLHSYQITDAVISPRTRSAFPLLPISRFNGKASVALT